MSSTREQDGSCVGCILLRGGRVPKHLHPTHSRGSRTALASSIAPTLEACDARTTTAMPAERSIAHPPQKKRTPGASSAAFTARAVVAFPRVIFAKRFALPQSLFLRVRSRARKACFSVCVCDSLAPESIAPICETAEATSAKATRVEQTHAQRKLCAPARTTFH